MEITVNGEPAIRIKGRVLKVYVDKGKGRRSKLCDCEGDKMWFPSSCVVENDDGTLDIQEWIYNKKFPNG